MSADPTVTTAHSPTADRYRGRGAPRSVWRRVLSAGLVVVVSGTLAYLVYLRFGTPDDVSGEETGFVLVDDSTLSLQLQVTRADPSLPAYCIVRARSIDGSETGRRELYVPPSTDDLVAIEATVRTSRPPVAGDVYGCGLDVPSYLVPR
ncbi:DUF4307 domain-containing protein [Rhodococcus aerolatus]